ncbi:hypothetical protein LRAMOSA01494 [Lichtheimia ramosa]|uniref:Protein kinase domain-containing protein n=1 Tax=Lichtheimia ramosa TaxID=688394 RepID=A0A077WJM9_9FUNG|nr:hypothetical protein LRAMOSA01494 [Lichtheimia ramosa]
MTRTSLMKRLMTLFKTTHQSEQGYPYELEKKYTVTRNTLGVGSFAVVKECISREDEKSYALKIILKKAIAGKEHMLDSELDILMQVHHPHIVSMHDMYESKDAVYIVTDLCEGGELFQQLLERGTYTEKDASNIVRQMLEGLAYLHEHDIVHRDIKPENLLFDIKDEEDAKLMITDFGLSKILKHHDDILMTACGTPGYVAPEVLLQVGHGKPVDIWSVGVVTYTLLSGYTPFWGEDQTSLFECITSGVYEYDEEYWMDISDQAKDFIDSLLTYNPNARITAEEALQHPWITGEQERETNLAPIIRKGANSHRSFRSIVTAMTLLSHWKHLEDVPEDDEESE